MAQFASSAVLPPETPRQSVASASGRMVYTPVVTVGTGTNIQCLPASSAVS